MWVNHICKISRLEYAIRYLLVLQANENVTNTSNVDANESLMIEESDADEIFADITLPERVSVVYKCEHIALENCLLSAILTGIICISGQWDSPKQFL